MLKRCFKCGVEKERSAFYAHPQMGDGLLGKCKECTKLDVRLARATNPRVRAYDRARAKQPHRVELHRKVFSRWVQQHPERRKAQHAANNAVRDGKLAKVLLCEGCGLPKKLEKHHPDYGKPLVVVWLCKPCHAIADKIRQRLVAPF